MNTTARQPLPDAVPGFPRWTFGLDLRRYDRRPWLTDDELAALHGLGPRGLRRGRHRGTAEREPLWQRLTRLAQPLDEARRVLRHRDDAAHRRGSADAAGLVLMRCGQVNRSFWAFTPDDWRGLLHSDTAGFRASMPWPVEPSVRPLVTALAYLLGGFDDFHELGTFNRMHLATLVFGHAAVRGALDQVSDVLVRWGYRGMDGSDHRLSGVFSQLLLLNRSPLVADLTDEAFTRLRQHPSTAAAYHRQILFAAHRAAAGLGYCQPPTRSGHEGVPRIEGTGQQWTDWLERWYATSTLTPKVRAIVRCIMAKAGRWLAADHPEVTDPGGWTRQTCAAWVATVDRMRVGDYVQRTDSLGDRAGAPILPRTKAHILMASRTFFRDCQEWEWIPRRFDPATALSVPRSVNALIGTNPRVIADDVWAKLLWAGMNLTQPDIPGGYAYYPMTLIRAVTLTWLFSGLRSDEIRRLRIGCIRWQHNGSPIPANSADVLAADAVCLLDVPVHKTGTAFTKPVDPLVGQAIETWQAERPHQPYTIDRKTGERIDLLFAVRAQPISIAYLNRTIIPALCRKAGVAATDLRGKITSHRARSTIASQLYNAKEPMTLFELQAWLGHRTPTTTQHYAKITPNTLAKAYRDAGYFARNIRTIEVLIDRDAVTTGAGQPWQHYDLGHGYCTYTFFEQCPHRMACARCDFYTPKASTKAQLLEAKTNLQHMLIAIPLTDDERAAVDDGQAALDSLINRLADLPTPAGPIPRQIGIPPTATHLPLIDITHGNIQDH